MFYKYYDFQCGETQLTTRAGMLYQITSLAFSS
jgi:hypothetical protein